ncbi:MAG: DUF3883 domain-containing protein [Planctomycetes bacterium]|nr:DUF3883 domain-containing protein [Planctomycetota bacterium]
MKQSGESRATEGTQDPKEAVTPPSSTQFPIGQRVHLPGHFPGPVTLERVRPIGQSFECWVRLADGTLNDTVISPDEAEALLGGATATTNSAEPVNAEQLRLLIESSRIRLAYAHDRHFAVSLSGIRTLPHQIEAVYQRMLLQPRLRFLLADDPGAGKTIMAGLLIKEMKLREAIDRVLVLCPAPLTIQWQDELSKWFSESFEIIDSARDKGQLINPWEKESQVIASLDYAKQDDVRERVCQQRWDLVIIDEAHKCSAYTKKSKTGDDVDKTKRYQLAERLASTTDNLLLLTATPHHGDDDRFSHFIRLLDPDVFPEPHRLGDRAREIRREILKLGQNCPWALRRLKEDLRDLNGNRIFPDRHAHTVPFRLNREEYDLYKAVTAYINQFLPHQGTGGKRQSVALARTVLQRRLASSTMAIFESIRRRLEKQERLLQELEELPPQQRAKRLRQIQGRLEDAEQDEDDLDDEDRDRLADEATVATELDHLRAEIAAIRELLTYARKVKDRASDTKLAALRDCLAAAEFKELQDGRGKLLIFTEHRDTLKYIREQLEKWGYSTCEIHGGMNPRERKAAQEKFRTGVQICVATEAAGEGINLQFCHLMINYDLPWNPTRLEQRLGRIHRIGQERDCYAFNFVASESEDGEPIVEGRILERLLAKLKIMKEVLDDRVFDVIGEVLSLNNVNLPEMLREVASNPGSLDDYLDQIERIDPRKLEQYEESTGIALARAHVDFSGFQQAEVTAEERRLMPQYVEDYFVKASRELGLKIDQRADLLWRIEHVLADVRADRLESVRRLGKPETTYRKVTFRKDHLMQDQHLDAVLVGPGHVLYAAIDERINEKLASLRGGSAVFVDCMSEEPYRLHFLELSILGQNTKGEQHTIHGELIAVRENLYTTDPTRRFEVVPADCLLDLPPHPKPPATIDRVEAGPASDFLRSTHQMDVRRRCQEDRHKYLEIARSYLQQSFDARLRAAQDRVMSLHAREKTSEDVAIALKRAENDLEDLSRTQRSRMEGLSRLELAKPGPVRHIGTALVVPSADIPVNELSAALGGTDAVHRRKAEIAAEDHVITFESANQRECERVGNLKIGFDIRSLAPADAQGRRDPVTGIRRIEVKGYARGTAIQLTTNEWYKALQLGDTYWLYVVWDPLNRPDPEPLRVQNPAKHLDHAKKEVVSARMFVIPADAIEAAAKAQRGGTL